MFMEAVMESLKDMEVRHPQDETQTTPTSGTVSAKPSSEKYASSKELSSPSETEQSSSYVVKQNMHSETETISNTAEVCKSLKSKSNSSLVIHSEKPASEQCEKPSLSSRDTPSSVTDSGHTSTSARSDSSASVQSSSDTDISHNTKATVTVVKNPASHIMDGLRRWDFNFFRNSHNR